MIDFNDIAEFVENDIRDYIHTLKEEKVSDELLFKVREKCEEILEKYRELTYQGVLNRIKVIINTDYKEGISVILADANDNLEDIGETIH